MLTSLRLLKMELDSVSGGLLYCHTGAKHMAVSMSMARHGGMDMKEFESKVGQKGQITLPAGERARLGIKPKDTVRIVPVEDGVKIERAESKIRKHFGSVPPINRPEDWAKLREEMETLMAEDALTRGQQ